MSCQCLHLQNLAYEIHHNTYELFLSSCTAPTNEGETSIAISNTTDQLFSTTLHLIPIYCKL